MEFNRIGDEILYAMAGLVVGSIVLWEAVKWLACNVSVSINW